MTLAVRPEVPLQVITAADVRASVRRARKSLEAAAEEIIWQSRLMTATIAPEIVGVRATENLFNA